MKKIVLAVLIILLLALTFPSISKVSATTEDLWTTPALPEIPREPTSDSPSGDYLNTTNPYSDLASLQGALDEVDDAEGANPLYVLVFGDEEDRQVWRNFPWDDDYIFRTWDEWATLQLERGDEALVANFGIDIRILGFLDWDSDDSKDTMEKLWYELEADTEQYLGEWYSGEAWSDYVDAVIGITAQDTPGDPRTIAGKAPPPEYLDQGRNFVLLRWQVYWADDNLVQHEVSHLFYAPDHYTPCCAMVWHTHFVWYTWEDALWIILADVECSYTTHDWCDDCSVVIDQKKSRYSGPFWLTISAGYGGTTSPTPGTYNYDYGTTVIVTAHPGSSPPYKFDYWILDGATKYGNPITVTMNSDHTLQAYFHYNNPPNTPSKPSGSTSGYVGKTYGYFTSTTDPDGDDVRYQFDWGDGSTTTTGWYTSGSTAYASHSWGSYGTYYVKVKAQDEYGAWSGWSSSRAVSVTSLCSLTINAETGGTTTPSEGTYEYPEGTSVTVTASAYPSYTFDYWRLDGAKVYDNPITVTMNSDHTLKAYFSWNGGAGGCPILSVFDGSEYVVEGLLDIHNPDGIDVLRNHTLTTTPQPVNHAYLLLLTEHPQTHSYIDHVELFAALENGTTTNLPLTSAVHSEHGNVLPKLLRSDDVRTDTDANQTIDLKFAVPNAEVAEFFFQIEGHNIYFKE